MAGALCLLTAVVQTLDTEQDVALAGRPAGRQRLLGVEQVPGMEQHCIPAGRPVTRVTGWGIGRLFVEVLSSSHTCHPAAAAAL